MSYFRLLQTMWRCGRRTPTPAHRIAEFAAKALLLPAARMSRRWQPGIVRIGITGSAGKTTTKKLIHAVLETRWRGIAGRGSSNRSRTILRSALPFQSGVRYSVQELGAFGPGTLDELIYAFRPGISVITNVGMEHYATFRTLDAVAEEKGKLVKGLPPDGLAVLNGDDPRVVAMRGLAPCRTILAGRHPDSDLRAEEVRAAWPAPLSLTVGWPGGRVEVGTQLYGEQWVFPVLASIVVGQALEIPMGDIVTAIGACRPEPGRMSGFRTAGGVDWVCDDWKAPVWSYSRVLDFLEEADAARKVLILGQFSDSPRRPRKLYARLARRGRAVADQVCLVGRHARHGLRARTDEDDSSIRAFSHAEEIARFLGGFLRPGDLVLVKATAGERARLSAEILGHAGDRSALAPSVASDGEGGTF